jgi:hypothetical protein
MTACDLEYQQRLKRDRIATMYPDRVDDDCSRVCRAPDRILNKELWPAGARPLARLFPSVING